MKYSPAPWQIGSIDGHFNISPIDYGRDMTQEITGTSDLYIYGKEHGPFGCLFTNIIDRDMLDESVFPEQKANANLIAAAPDLLEACEVALTYRYQTHFGANKSIQILESAIKKAKGA